MMPKCPVHALDVVIVGGGVVGCALAHELAHYQLN
jgi:L-2-hydroxyglutarate oxidase LhgO